LGSLHGWKIPELKCCNPFVVVVVDVVVCALLLLLLLLYYCHFGFPVLLS
jgi:hypothetical protein